MIAMRGAPTLLLLGFLALSQAPCSSLFAQPNEKPDTDGGISPSERQKIIAAAQAGMETEANHRRDLADAGAAFQSKLDALTRFADASVAQAAKAKETADTAKRAADESVRISSTASEIA